MGSKGNRVQTQSSQTYTPDPRIQQAGYQAITGAESAAQQPFQMPVAPVAGFTPFQQQAFGATQNALGMAQPYFGLGSQYLQGSAAPISGQDVAQYYNPMAGNVFAQLQNVFGRQMQQATGQATQAAGGVGADRIGVAQANLANQQGLAAGQTAAGLYQQALQAAQQQKQMQAGAGYGLGQFGPAAQAAQLQSIGALGQAGAQQQALAQAQQNAQYQNQLAQIAYPFQTPQYLAGIAGGLAPALGGTTQGQSTTTYPTPSALNQALGVGTSALGLFGGMGGLGGMGAGMGAKGAGLGAGLGDFAAMLPMLALASGGAAYGKLAEQKFENSPIGNPYSDSSDGYARGGDIDNSRPNIEIPTPTLRDVVIRHPLGDAEDEYLRDAERARFERYRYAEGGDIEQPAPFPGASTPTAGGMSPIPMVAAQIPKGISPVPYLSLRAGTGQRGSLDLRPQSKTMPSLQGQETTGGDISKAINLAKGVENLFAASGGAVNPYDFGQGFQEGGDIDENLGNPFDNSYSYSVPGPPISAPDVPLPRGRPDTTGGVRSTMANEWARAGMSPYGISGINMNVADESQFNPNLRHFDQPNPRFRGTEAQNAHGLYQEGGDEWNNYQNWLQKNAPGSDWRDPALQSRFTAENLRENYPQVWNQMQSARTPGEAAAAFAKGYLKPASQYLSARVNKYLGTEGEGDENLPSHAIPTGYVGAGKPNADMTAGQYMLPPGDRPYPDALNRDWGQNLARSPWMSLVKAGAAMATTTGPVGSAIGKGIAAGAGELEGQRKELRSEQDINLKAQQLFQQAQQHLDKYQRIPAGEQAELGMKQQLLNKQLQQLELEGLKPFKIGEDTATGLDIYGVRDRKTGQIVPIDPTTGRPRGMEGPAGTAAPSVPAIESKPATPAPLGLDEFRPNLSPTKSTAPTMVKGPFATAEAGNIRNIDQQMNKERGALDVQHDQLNRLKMDYATVMKDSDKDGFFTRLATLPGADPETRVNAMRTANLAAMAAKKPPVFPPEKVAAMEEAIKIQKTMGMSFAATISPRDAMQMQLASISAQPGFTQSPQGMQRLIGLYDGLVNHNEARHDFWGRWKQTNPRTSTGWEEDFRTKNPVDTYTTRALIENMPNQKAKAALPQAVEHLRQHRNDPAEVAKFDKIFNNTSSYFLNGRLDPYAALR